jgi:hypothetical protein
VHGAVLPRDVAGRGPHLLAVPEGHRQHGIECSPQALQGVGGEAGMRAHSLAHERMGHLQQECGRAAGHDGSFAGHVPGGGIRPEQPLVAG